MNFECHITFPLADGEKAKALVSEKRLPWKYSAIDGDPILGPGLNAYLTTHGTNMLAVYQRMQDVAHILTLAGINVTRMKIELIMYDSRTGEGV